jgi:peptide/nickel transport system permease protein
MTQIEAVEQPRSSAAVESRSNRVAAFFRSAPVRLTGKRLLQAIPVLWGVTVLTYFLLSLLPGDAAEQLLGPDATPAQVATLEIKLGLNQPIWERYWHWFTGAITGNLGTSLASGQPVTTIVGDRLPVTFELIVYAFVISLVLALLVAVLAARRPNGVFDRITMVFSMVGLSVAPYVLALVLILVFAVSLSWLPALGYTPLTQDVGGNIRSLTLPAFAIGIPLAGFYARLLRADILDQMRGEEYVVTARAKGISPWRVLTRHALRNSLFGLVTVVGLNFSTMFGGTVIIEQVFGLPGIGQELFLGIQSRDVPAVEGIVVIFAVIIVIIGILTDLLYSVLDPRIRHGQSAS